MSVVNLGLLTREAFAVYLRHLTPGGIIACNITNDTLDLRPAWLMEALPRWLAEAVPEEPVRFLER